MDTENEAEKYLDNLKDKFGFVEYIVFSIVLAFSAGIGIFYGFFSGRKKTNDEFLMGSRQMSAWPVALSLLCSFVSAITMLGNPVETYLYGTQYMTIILTFPFMTLSLMYLYVPVYFELKLTSAYELFEIRFNSTVRMVASLINSFYLIFYMALVVYGPALALNQVTGFDTLTSVGVIFAVCMFYSTLGGFRAVIWTDALQAVMMMVSITIVVIRGLVEVDGFGPLWEKLYDTRRVEFFRWDADTRTRHSVWSVLFGGYFLYLTLFGGTQANIQRYCAMPDMKTVKKALWINFFGLFITIGLCTFSGLIIFAKYYDCDPINAKLVDATDQILPLFVMDILGDYPGLPGLFVAGITCASLSSVSSGLNAVAAMVVNDYVIKWNPHLPEQTLFKIARITSLLAGVLSFGFIFVAKSMGDIFPAAISLIGMFLGPTLGLFTLAILFPWANSFGALSGYITSYAVTMFIAVGSVVEEGNKNLPVQRLSLSTEGCVNFTDIVHVNHTYAPGFDWKDRGDSAYIQLMSCSYLLFPLIGCCCTVVFGLIFSGISHFSGLNKDKPVNRRCLTPVVLQMWEWMFPTQMAILVDSQPLKIKNMLEDQIEKGKEGTFNHDYEKSAENEKSVENEKSEKY